MIARNPKASKSAKTGRSRNSATGEPTTGPRLSRQRKPAQMPAPDWQRTLRRQFARDQAFELVNLSRDKPAAIFSDHSVFNPDSGGRYRVSIRGTSPGDNLCTCLDYATNDLGTCKHIEFALVPTGTPLENRREELVSIVQLVDQHRLGPTWRFLQEHQHRDDAGRVVGYRDLDRIGATLAPILLRRRKAEVLTQQPERVDQLRLRCALQNMRMSCNSAWLLDHETDFGTKAEELVDRFSSEPGCRLFLSTDAGGVGLNWLESLAGLLASLRR